MPGCSTIIYLAEFARAQGPVLVMCPSHIPSLNIKSPAVTDNVCQQLNPPGGNTFQGISVGRGGEIKDNISGWAALLPFISLPVELPGGAAFPIIGGVIAFPGRGRSAFSRCFCVIWD